MTKKKLTTQQSKFVEAMANPRTKNQTQAAIAAGCPPNSARVQASKWLTKANISEAVEQRKQRAIRHARITSEEVLGSAVFNMRSSMDDVLDESGSFSLEKARATGAIDIVKKLKETITTDKKGDTKRVLEIELLSPADARKEVADYIGNKKLPPSPPPMTDEETARELFRRLVELRGLSKEEAIEGVSGQFPNVDVKLLTDGI